MKSPKNRFNKNVLLKSYTWLKKFSNMTYFSYCRVWHGSLVCTSREQFKSRKSFINFYLFCCHFDLKTDFISAWKSLEINVVSKKEQKLGFHLYFIWIWIKLGIHLTQICRSGKRGSYHSAIYLSHLLKSSLNKEETIIIVEKRVDASFTGA